MMKIQNYKQDYRNAMAVVTLLSVVPPLAMLFIIVDWYKGAKVNFVSVIGLVFGVVLSVVYYMQLTNQM